MLLAINLTIDSNLITAVVGPIVPLILAYIAYKTRETTKATQETKVITEASAQVATDTKVSVGEVHTIVNSQRTELLGVVTDLRAEIAMLRSGMPPSTPVGATEAELIVPKESAT